MDKIYYSFAINDFLIRFCGYAEDAILGSKDTKK